MNTLFLVTPQQAIHTTIPVNTDTIDKIASCVTHHQTLNGVNVNDLAIDVSALGQYPSTSDSDRRAVEVLMQHLLRYQMDAANLIIEY